MGRDPGYVAALLDPARPSRARPTPGDLLALSDATGIPLLEMLESLWGIPIARLARELTGRGPSGEVDVDPGDQAIVAEFARFLAARGRAADRPEPPKVGE